MEEEGTWRLDLPIHRVGHSAGVILPAKVLRKLGLEEGDKATVLLRMKNTE